MLELCSTTGRTEKVFSQIIGAVHPRVESKILRMASDPDLDFDLAAAMVPVQLLCVAFTTSPTRAMAEAMRNPLTLLGLGDHPWCFLAKDDLRPLMRCSGAPVARGGGFLVRRGGVFL